MNSVDTNILLYATNRDCPEHPSARPVYERLLAGPFEWIIADQVLYEFYRALRNPRILERPLEAEEAVEQIRFLRKEAGCLHCAYEASMWKEVTKWLAKADFPSRLVFDAVLAVTLKANGVRKFYTRNVKDFAFFDFFELIDPIGE